MTKRIDPHKRRKQSDSLQELTPSKEIACGKCERYECVALGGTHLSTENGYVDATFYLCRHCGRRFTSYVLQEETNETGLD